MDITYNGKYKSIESLNWQNIPKLSIITGKNGAGKSQLLDVINASILKNWTVIPNLLSYSNEFAQITNEDYRSEHVVFLRGEWGLSDLDAVGLNTIQQERENFYTLFIRYFGTYINLDPVAFSRIRESNRMDPYHSDLEDKFDTIIEKNCLFNNKHPTKAEFLNVIPKNLLQDIRQQASNSNIGKVFYNYRLDLIEAKANGTSEEEFIAANSEKPWLQINQLFKDIDLPFALNNPEETNMRDMYTPVLKNVEKDIQIKFSDLSSGEKVLVSLVFWLFNSNDKGVFPKLLLLDEPDSYLHPSMIKQFLYVLKDVLCTKYDVRVIMTTHSPSTVAIAPEESLFVMKKDGNRIEKIKKDSALRLLTSGVPSFSVNYENRRQVFVESPNDVYFYESLYHKLNSHLSPEISLTFISAGESKTDKNGVKIANCDQVINICKTLQDAGNKFIWGIIDRDKDNKPNKYPYIKVLGDNSRYAIENYLFDPILIGAMLLREKIITKEELSLTETECYTDFKRFPQDKLQGIANFVVGKIGEKVKPTKLEVDSVSYLNGITINVPKWYLIHHGHELEAKILEAFPKLNIIKKDKEDLLKKEMIDKIIDDIPELIPLDILDAFRFVQKT